MAQGVHATNAEEDVWFEYSLAGPRPLTVAVAHDPGTAVILIGATGDAEVERTLTAVMLLLQSYSLRELSG